MKTEFVDFHSHGCWGIDDGVDTKDEAVLFLQTAVESGTKILFCTPHMIPQGKFDNQASTIIDAVNALKRLALECGFALEIRHGCEFYLNEYAVDRIVEGCYLTLEGTDCLLVEFSRIGTDWRVVNDRLYEASLLVGSIIIAHPERYFSDDHDMETTVDEWLANGYLLQINATSLLNVHGEHVARNAWKLLENGKIHLISSDAHHGSQRRTCRLDDIYASCMQRLGKARAEKLFIENPSLILEGKKPSTIPKLEKACLKQLLRRISKT
jgi:protein-tyrosine phosphatase